MEPVIVLPLCRHHYYPGDEGRLLDIFDAALSTEYRTIGRGTFQYQATLPHSILHSSCHSPQPSKRAFSVFHSPNYDRHATANDRSSNAIPITSSTSAFEKSFNEDLSCSERWAGPAYPKSPPPNSLPIPQFSLRKKRSVSLKLPLSVLNVDDYFTSKSAPPSPMGGTLSSSNAVFHFDVSATENLRKILHLD